MLHTAEISLTLHTTLKSGPGRKALAVCYHLGVEPQLVSVDVYAGQGQTPAYRAVNPFGKVPTLSDGDFVLWESNAIAFYLAERFGEPRLYARDPAKRADMLRYMFWESAHFQPAFAPVLTEFVGTALVRGREHADPERVQWRQDPLWALCRFLDEHLLAHRFVSSGELTVADLAVAGMLTYARAARFPFGTFSGIARWYEGIEALPAWQRTQCALWQP